VGWESPTYFFSNFEDFKVAGALNRQTISIPSLKERQGDFSDWIDPQTGSLIPEFDPATLRANPNFNATQPVGRTNLPYLRDQFMGCDGHTPNVICSSDPRLQKAPGKDISQGLRSARGACLRSGLCHSRPRGL
jgi:hypothetical protein